MTKKKNPTVIIAFVLFIVIFPIATVWFSKTGLDRYKGIRNEMRFLEDSIRVNFEDLTLVYGDALSNASLKGKLILAGFNKDNCLPTLVEEMKAVQAYLSEEDQKKLLFFVHTNQLELSDSLIHAYYITLEIDSSQWKLVNAAMPSRYQIEALEGCATVALMDGRVSRKDKTNNYLKGPLLGDYYNLEERQEVESLLRHMAILMPAKRRKSITYKAEEKLYHSNKDSTNNE